MRALLTVVEPFQGAEKAGNDEETARSLIQVRLAQDFGQNRD